MKTTTIADPTTLIAQLVAHDIRHLRAVKTVDQDVALNPATLIAALAQHPDARLREALILLFLRQPMYACYVPGVAAILEADASLTLRHMYTAAAYLQRLWRSTLGIYLGELPLLPDYFGQIDFSLPAPEVHFGEAGLRALAAFFQAQTGYDWLSTYHAAISLLLAQLSLEATADG